MEGRSRKGEKEGDRIKDKTNMKAPGPALGDSGDTQWVQYPGCQGSPAGRLEPRQTGSSGHAVSGSPSRLALPLASQ